MLDQEKTLLVNKPPLPLYYSSSTLTFEQLHSLPRVELSRNFDGSQSNSLLTFALGFDRNSLFFLVESKQPPHDFENTKPSSYVEGLWERDVAEIFITSTDQAIYQEFNLSPSGAWWSMVFDSPRSRTRLGSAGHAVETRNMKSPSSWLVSAKFPISLLSIPALTSRAEIPLEIFSNLRINVCACLGISPRTFLSFAQLPGSQADFHQPGSFPPIMVISLT